MIILILKGCALVLFIALCIAIGGAIRERWAIWNSPVERALRRRDCMQHAYGDIPHERGLS